MSTLTEMDITDTLTTIKKIKEFQVEKLNKMMSCGKYVSCKKKEKIKEICKYFSNP